MAKMIYSYEEEDVTYMVPVLKSSTTRDIRLTPISIMVVGTMILNSVALLKVLFDPGSTKALEQNSLT